MVTLSNILTFFVINHMWNIRKYDCNRKKEENKRRYLIEIVLIFIFAIVLQVSKRARKLFCMILVFYFLVLHKNKNTFQIRCWWWIAKATKQNECLAEPKEKSKCTWNKRNEWKIKRIRTKQNSEQVKWVHKENRTAHGVFPRDTVVFCIKILVKKVNENERAKRSSPFTHDQSNVGERDATLQNVHFYT